MSQRANPQAARDAVRRQLQRGLHVEIPDDKSGETRTTYSVSKEARHALRLLAFEQDCKINDLVVVAIEDLLRKHSALLVQPTRPDLRRRLQEPNG
jgi:hypothetical protein